MHIGRRALGWGVFFIVVGAVSLAARQGWLDARVLSDVGRLWPLILVAIGIGLILERSPFGALGSAIVGATFGLLVGGVLATGPVGLGCVGVDSGPAGFATSPRGDLFTGTTASVRLHLSCGELTVTPVSGSGWAVNGVSDRLAVRSGPDSLEVEPTGGTFFLPADRGRARVEVTVPTAVTVALSLLLDAGRLEADLGGARLSSLAGTVNAGDGRVDLSAATVSTLSLTVNAGNLDLWLPATSTRADVTVNAGKVSVCVPDGVGLRVTSTEVLASTTFGVGFSRQDGAWVSANWATATQRTELRLTINVGSATVGNGGCS
jgi:hypothetical protein